MRKVVPASPARAGPGIGGASRFVEGVRRENQPGMAVTAVTLPQSR